MKNLLLLLLLLAPTVNADKVLHATDWIDSEEMTQVLQKMNKNHMFPCRVVGSVKESKFVYKASYCGFSPDMRHFYSRWGMSESDYESYSAHYAKQKMKPHFHTTFTDEDGGTRHQATWILMNEKRHEPEVSAPLNSTVPQYATRVERVSAIIKAINVENIKTFVALLKSVVIEAMRAFGYWLDGMKIEFYSSDQYRQEAVALMDADSTFMTEYHSETWRLYEQRDFPGLAVAIEKSQTATEAGIIPLALWRDMDVFYGNDLDKEKVLNGWVETEPDNWIPYAARAEYLLGEGWRSRGEKYASDTTDEQFAGMRKSFKVAEKDLVKTLALKPEFTGSYYNYLQLARNGVGARSEAGVIELALERGLGDYYLRYQYMDTLQPKWGGSFREMRGFALKSQRDRDADPRVYQLLGYEYQIRGERASRDKKWEACVEHYTTAFEYGDLYAWRYGRAKCNEKLQRWKDLIPDLEVVGAKTGDHWAFSRVARAYANLKRYREALTSIEKAIELEPEVVAHTNYAGWLYMKMGNDDLALDAFAKSLSTSPKDVYAADNLARIHLSRHEREAALPFLEISVNYDEHNAQKWFLYADVLNHLDKSEYRAALERFLELVDRSDSRWTKRIEMAEAHLAGRGKFE